LLLTTTVRFQQVPTIAVDSGDRVYIGWREYDSALGGLPSSDVYKWGYVAANNTTTFNLSAVLPFGSAPSSPDRLAFVVDGNNVLHAFATTYSVSGATASNLLHASSSDQGASWTQKASLNVNSGATL